MVTGFARTFVISGFVECDIDVLAVAPLLAEHGKFEAIGLEGGAVIGDGIAGDRNVAVSAQLLAKLASAEALRLQDAVQG